MLVAYCCDRRKRRLPRLAKVRSSYEDRTGHQRVPHYTICATHAVLLPGPDSQYTQPIDYEPFAPARTSLRLDDAGLARGLPGLRTPTPIRHSLPISRKPLSTQRSFLTHFAQHRPRPQPVLAQDILLRSYTLACFRY